MIIEPAIEEMAENEWQGTVEEYIFDRLQGEMGWNIERSGVFKAALDWVQGLALNVDYMNWNICEWGKANGLLRKNASEWSMDNFIEGYWLKLATVVTRIYNAELAKRKVEA